MRDEHLFEENQVVSKEWILEKFPSKLDFRTDSQTGFEFDKPQFSQK